MKFHINLKIFRRPRRYIFPFLYHISYLNFLKQKVRDHLFFRRRRRNIHKKDLLFVVSPGHRGKSLDFIPREISRHFKGDFGFVYTAFSSSLPAAKAYYIAHYHFFPHLLQLNPIFFESKTLVHCPHISPTNICEKEFAFTLNKATHSLCECSESQKKLIMMGVKAERTTVMLHCANPQLFSPHQRSKNGYIGFVGFYSERKNPFLILEIIKKMYHRKFILIGVGWQDFPLFSELTSLPNFRYIEAPYEKYPEYYALMDVYVSVAKREGGPISLVEAMMSNAVPVATKTGMAPDIITHGKNGFTVDVDSPVEDICKYIELAFELKTDVRETVKHLTWENYTRKIEELIR